MELTVRLFDKLELTDGTRTVTEADLHSGQMSRLLAYMIVHRDVGCSASQLIDQFWEADTANPVNTLKNLIYRLRKLLRQYFPDQEFIHTGKGLYQWNIPEVKVDSEQFEALLEEAGRAARKPEKIRLLRQAIELYRGRYLSSITDYQTVMFQQTYYHNLYVDAVCQLAESYEEEMDFDNMERLLERALLIESMEERLHCLLLKAYIGKNRLSLAEQYYHKTVLLLEDHLGEEIAEEMRGIYRELLKRQHSRETDLQRISADLLSFSEKRDSAFYCQYGVFQNIYELEFRRKERMDYPLSLVLISVYSPQEEDALASARKENAGMRHLRAALAARLRHGDVFTRYSNTQFLVMLTGCEEGDVDNVMDHVLEEYYSKARRGGASIQYSALEQGRQPRQPQ